VGKRNAVVATMEEQRFIVAAPEGWVIQRLDAPSE
jgi:hypothetical protein